MDNTKDIALLLQQLEQSSRRQARYAKIQCALSFVIAACFLGILLMVLRVLPKVDQVVQQAQTVTMQAQGLAEQASVVLGNLETVTQDLAEVDLGGMVSNVDALVTDSQEGIRQALEKINSMDIDVLNQAIADLSDVVAPLARVSKMFQ